MNQANYIFKEIFNIIKFIRYKDKFYLRIETDKDHSDHIYVFDANGKMIKKLNVWGQFQLVDL